MDEYRIDPYIHDPWFYDPTNPELRDEALWLRLCREGHGPALEICCGSGRILLPLARAGIDISGVDIDPRMLGAARARLEAAGLRVELHEADIRTFDLGRRFATILCPFNSLQCLYDSQDVERAFDRVKAHLAEDGHFAFEVFNPSIHYMVEGERGRRPVADFEDADGHHVIVEETCRYDDAGQVNRVTWYFRIDDRPEIPQQLDMRCFFPQEMDALVRHTGFRVLAKYGDHDGRAFARGAPRQIYVLGL